MLISIANVEAVNRKGTHTQCHFGDFGPLAQNPQNDIVYCKFYTRCLEFFLTELKKL